MKAPTRPGIKERDQLARREDVLAAAERVFSKNGFHGTFVSQIAEEAQLSVGTLYKLFSSKEALYIALIEDHFRSFLSHLECEVASTADVPAMLHLIIKAHLDYFERHKDFFLIYLSDRLALEWRIKERLGENIHLLHLRYLDIVSAVMERGVATGLLKPMAPQDLAHLLISMVNSIVFQWVHARQKYPLREKLPVILDTFFHGSLRQEKSDEPNAAEGQEEVG
jgi:AcrR family transcriptional regulator